MGSQADVSMDGAKVPIFLERPGLYFLQLRKPCGTKNMVHFLRFLLRPLAFLAEGRPDGYVVDDDGNWHCPAPQITINWSRVPRCNMAKLRCTWLHRQSWVPLQQRTACFDCVASHEFSHKMFHLTELVFSIFFILHLKDLKDPKVAIKYI